MSKEITTKAFQDKVKKIAGEFVEFVNSNKEFHDQNYELMLLLNKISSNIQAATLLSSRMLFSESKIILRSAFETLVLFEYILEFPNELQHYKDDNIITEIHTIYAFYKRGYAKFQDVINICEKYKTTIKTKLPFIIEQKNGVVTYETTLLDKYFGGKDRKSFKPLSQKTSFMINKLVKAKNFIAPQLNEFQVIIYNINSQVAHSRLDTLFLPLNILSNDETIKELQTCFSNSAMLLYWIINTLKIKCGYENSQKLSYAIFDTMKYLNFAVPNFEE